MNRNRWRILIAAWLGALASLAHGQAEFVPDAAGGPVEVRLTAAGKAVWPVAVAPETPDAVRAAAGELAAYLERITGSEFAVVEGDGSEGIAVGTIRDFPDHAKNVAFDPADPLRREEYVLRSHEQGVWLIGATELAVQHAVWDFLYRLGYRQFFPGSRWEVVPSVPEPVVALDALEKPAYHARRIWYGYGPLPSRVEVSRQWSSRNRVVQGFSLHSSHYYEAIIAANAESFAANPEFYALVGGERRTSGGDVKFCISNPGLRQLVVAHAERELRAHPGRDSISMDPSDGGNWCECEPCAGMGSVSDRVLALANEVAVAINGLGLGSKYVGILAYNEHSPPPSIRVHPNVIVTATAGFIRGGYTLDQVIGGWQARDAVMGVYDYFSVMPWDWDMPGRARAARPSYMVETIPRFHAMNVRFHDAESSDNWGPNGLGYYVASRILWDLQEAERFDEIVDDFLQRAFGPAREPLAAFYRLIDGAHPPLLSQNLVGRMYRSLAEGRRLAAGDAGILGRIEDLTLYTRYVELKLNRDEFGALRHAHRIRDRGLVHFQGMWPWRETAHRVALETIPAEWLEEACYEAAEVMAMIESGIAANPVVEFTPVAFSEDLVPATPLELPEVERGNLGHLYPGYGRQGGLDMYTWMEEPGAVTLKVTGGLIPHYRDRGHVRISLFSPQEVLLEPVAHDDSVPPDGVEREVTLRTPYSGLHRLELHDGGDASRILWQDGQPMTLPCSPEAPPPVYGTWSLYFYVPKGTPTVAGYTSSSGRLVDGDGNAVYDFADIAVPAYFAVPVPEGQDGRLWRVDRAAGRVALMTVPPYLARNVQELLLPREVVERDAPR